MTCSERKLGASGDKTEIKASKRARAYVFCASQDWSLILKFRLGNTPRLEYRAPIFGNQIKKGNRLGKK